MAGKTTKTKAPSGNAVLSDLKQGTLKNLYLLYGEEAELRRVYTERLIRAVGNETDGMNFQRFDGRAATPDAIMEAADTMPFFAESRTILVKDSGLFKSKQDELADYLKALPPTTYLIFSEAEADRKYRLYKTVEECGCAQEFVRLTGQALKTEVAVRIAKAGLRVKESTVDYLLEQTGTDLTAVQNQLDKVCAYAMGREELTKEDVDAVVTNLAEREAYLLTGAVADRDRKAAMDCYYELMRMKAKAAEPMGLIVQLINLFQLLLQIKELRLKGEDEKTIISRVKVNPGRYYYLKKQAAVRTREELIGVLKDCVRAEEDIIRRGMNDRVTLEMLIVRHTTPAA